MIKEMLSKIKNSAKVKIITGLTALVMAAGCGNVLDPLGTKIAGLASAPSTEAYSEADAKISEYEVTQNPHQEVQVAYQTPADSGFSEWADVQEDENGKYSKTISSATNGTFLSKYRARCGLTWNESEAVSKDVYMSEAKSDSELNSIITPLVKPGSTTDGDIIAASFNQNAFFTHLYNNDALLTIYDSSVGGNQRSYIVDAQGSAGDVFNSQKKTDADASSISYNNIGKFSSSQDLDNKINELEDTNWPRTDQ